MSHHLDGVSKSRLTVVPLLAIGSILGLSGSARALDRPGSCSVSNANPPPAIAVPRHSEHRPDCYPFVLGTPPAPPAAVVLPEGAPEALTRARDALRRGEPGLATLQLDLLGAAFPAIADRAALLQGGIALAAGAPLPAREAFLEAQRSPVGEVKIAARVGYVRGLIAADDRRAPAALGALLQAFPELPEEPTLWLERAESLERTGQAAEAIRLYRAVDVSHPGSPAARRAQAHLARLRAEGRTVRDLTPLEEARRAERLVARGPLAEARLAVEALVARRAVPPSVRAEAHLLAAHLARMEGRWEDARLALLRAQGAGAPSPDFGFASELARAGDMAAAASAGDTAAAERRLRQLTAGRPPRALPGPALLEVVRLAARIGDSARVDGTLAAMCRRQLPAPVLFDAAMLASGSASEPVLRAVLDEVTSRPGPLQTAARYHAARSLEREGETAEARARFTEVVALDRSSTRYYAMWSENRLAALDASITPACPTGLACAGDAPPRGDAMALGPADRDALVAELAALASVHGEAYPWIPRAQALLQVGDHDTAGAELYEAYLAWREARGRAIPRAGLDSVARGADRPRSGGDWPTRQKRLQLTAEEARKLAEVAKRLGEVGTAIGFGDEALLASLPRPHAAEVEAAARAHGLDPRLLYAVMRVESVYQRRIVSYAGAIGLMQIMPRTGTLIARERGIDDFTTADLLDPATNLDFAAWYLASLIERFQGDLPLAIAAYNGGPHNVLRWMQDHGSRVPLDAFLERIPFEQTHRYVRRVLTHYAAYRGREGAPLGLLPVALPPPSVDSLGF